MVEQASERSGGDAGRRDRNTRHTVRETAIVIRRGAGEGLQVHARPLHGRGRAVGRLFDRLLLPLDVERRILSKELPAKPSQSAARQQRHGQEDDQHLPGPALSELTLRQAQGERVEGQPKPVAELHGDSRG
jgi:hypothetical protein